MTRIVGRLKDSGNFPLNGTLRVTLDAPFVNSATTPDSYLLPVPRDFEIVDGVVDIELAQSETLNVTYRFEILQIKNVVTYFTEAGVEYSGAVHLFDGQYYTGFSHTVDSVLLYRIETENLSEVDSFSAMVPNLPQVEFTSLIKTGISIDILDSSIRRLAMLLTSDEHYAEVLRGGPRVQGNYNPSVFYRRGDLVRYAGSAWLYIDQTPSAGSTPSTVNNSWLLFGQKGDPGDGVAGQDTPFDEVGWNGAQWVPTANALRDYLVQLAPLFSPVFDGVPTCPTPDSSSNDLTIVNSFWVNRALFEFANNTALRGSPTTPLPLPDDDSDRIASTAFVKDVVQRYSQIEQRVPAGTVGGTATAGVFNTRPLNTIAHNSGDVVSLVSNQFTLRPGTYVVAIDAVHGAGVGQSRILLRNVTAASNQLISITSQTTHLGMHGRFTVSTNSTFELRSVVTTTVANTGLGSPANLLSLDEVYTQIRIWRID